MIINNVRKVLLAGLFVLFATNCLNAEVVKKCIDGVYYNFDTSTRIVTYVTGQGAGTNRTEFKGTSLHVPATMQLDGVTYTMGNIGNAFQGCPNLRDLTFDSPVKFKEISLWAFAQCPKLLKVEVPEGVEVLGADRAFGSDESLEEITLPSTLTKLASYSLFDDPALKVVRIKALTPPQMGSMVFAGRTNCTIVVPDAALATYQRHKDWKGYDIVSESEYANPSYKTKLRSLLKSMAPEMKTIKSGKGQDVMPIDKYQTLVAAWQEAERIAGDALDDELYEAAYNKLTAALADANNSYNPLTRGYYFIKSGYGAFAAPRAMTVKSGQLSWEIFDDFKEAQVFYVNLNDNGTLSLKSYNTNQYVALPKSGTAMTFDAEGSEFVITPMTRQRWLLSSPQSVGNVLYPSGHGSGTANAGLVNLFATTDANDACGWVFAPVGESMIEYFETVREAPAKAKELETMHLQADTLINSTLAFTVGTEKLITNANQFASNAKSAYEGTYESLIDGRLLGTTYFQSTKGNPADPGEPHYLQVSLDKSIKSFSVQISRRNASEGFKDAPTQMAIYGSRDGKTWSYATTYNMVWTASKSYEFQTTPPIMLDQAYTHLRFVVEKTSENRHVSGFDHPYFSLSEFQLYEVEVDEANSTYYTVSGMKEAVDDLRKLIAEQKGLATTSYITADDIAMLDAAMFRVQHPQPPVIRPLNLGTVTASGINATWCAIGNAVTTGQNSYTYYVNDGIRFGETIVVPLGESCLNKAYFKIPKADYYSLEAGLYDWAHGVELGTISDYANNTNSGSFANWYRKIIDRICQVNPKAKIVLCTTRKAYDFVAEVSEDCYAPVNGVCLKDFAQLIRAIGEYEGYPVADFFANSGGPHDLESLSVPGNTAMPNAAGAQIMSRELVNALEKVLKYDAN